MTKTHLIYRIPRHSGILGKIYDKVFFTIPWLIPPWRYNLFIPWRKPNKAPLSISYNLLKTFRASGKVRFYDLHEKRTCHLSQNDILLALPCKTLDEVSWKHPSVFKITAKTFEAYPAHKNKFLIMPYTHDVQHNSSIIGLVKKHGENVILICGEYWTDTWDKSPIKPYVKNLLRVDMAIDSDDYPTVKEAFNPKGERKFLYVGHTEYYKNTKQLETIAKIIPNFEGGHIGRGSIKGWEKISNGADLTPEFMGAIAKKYDVFLNTSKADAQATTILEHMCFGFLVACTPESGYSYDSIIPLSPTDTSYNVRQIKKIQNLEEGEILRLTRKNREYAIKFHNWETFSKKITDFIYGK